MDDFSKDEVLREESSHGDIWNNMHGGYFSSHDIAAPYIAKIADVIDIAKPGIIVDLGGGTGFILDKLSKKNIVKDVELIDLELSEEQLDSIKNNKIKPQKGSISSFYRKEFGFINKKTLFLSRSTIHYAGLFGLEPLLRHIREQMYPNEYFIHQTACFIEDEDAEILNLIYEMMGTEKGYPTVYELSRILEKVGFEVLEISKVQSLELTSSSLMTRYKFDRKRLNEMIEKFIHKFSKEKEGVFQLTPNGFSAFLHYKLFTCRAV